MKSDGSEGTERKAGPEDDVQRTCHFSTKSRSTSLSFNIVKSGEQILGGALYIHYRQLNARTASSLLETSVPQVSWSNEKVTSGYALKNSL